MHKSRCTVRGSCHSVKNGKRKGVQTYKCRDCGYQFRNGRLPDDIELWSQYLVKKQTVKELSESFGTSQSTIKRRLRDVSVKWEQPQLSGLFFIHIFLC